ncbi:hypothetical protein OPV22_017456 [Ensete ventricosum]|uniref:Uncharacterized protein n=1 Tax=Ensete ventricosum TaxID=4639 RepID=A0AAV8PHQ9_ENSVE|nr:hypothetical protein OPV22_017456 [Ensete ventricosum]
MAVDEGFITRAARNIIISTPSAKELIRKFEEYVSEYEANLVWDTENEKQTWIDDISDFSFLPYPTLL